MSQGYVNPYQPFAEAELRTALAAEAMAGLLANSRVIDDMAKASQSNGPVMMAGLASLAVNAADALIAELNKENP